MERSSESRSSVDGPAGAHDAGVGGLAADVGGPVADLDWAPERAREFGTAMVELWTEYLAGLRSGPVSTPRSVDSVRSALLRDVPAEPLPDAELFRHLRELALHQATLTGHPGFMGYISGSGTVPGAAADLLAAGLNQNVGGWRLSPGASEIESHLMRWFTARLGLPTAAGGMVTTGGAMSAFIGLKLARDRMCGWDVRRSGVAAGPRLAVYASAGVHDVNMRAADMLGLGSEAVRLLPAGPDGRMDAAALRESVARDRTAGLTPIAVIATAGSVGTGAIDPLDEIADSCQEHGLWLHVDGAYGAVAALTTELAPLFAGLHRADSIVLDPHKWLYTPHSGGVLLVRDAQLLSDSFSIDPSYTYQDRDASGAGPDFFSLTPNFSRGFHALKIWVSLLAHGWDAYSRRIVHDTKLAAAMRERAAAHPELEAYSPQSLSICCFRYVPPALRDDPAAAAYIDRLNERIMSELQVSGRVFPSNAVIGGRFFLRACIVNFRTELPDVEALLAAAVAAGRDLHARSGPGAG